MAASELIDTRASLATDVASLAELAEMQGSEKKARALLKALDVPLHAGLFSRRLFIGKLEQHRPQHEKPGDAFAAAVARHGLLVLDEDRGRRATVLLRAEHELRIGNTEFTDVDGIDWQPTFVHAGGVFRARLYIASRRDDRGTAAFNITGIDDASASAVYFLYIVDEDRLLVFQRIELAYLRDTLTAKDRPHGFSSWRGNGIRIAVPKSRTSFAAELVITLVAPPTAQGVPADNACLGPADAREVALPLAGANAAWSHASEIAWGPARLPRHARPTSTLTTRDNRASPERIKKKEVDSEQDE
jgi:hypothetical protein